jgi:glucokinase
MPGPFDYETGVSWMKHKLPYLYGVDLRGAFAERRGWAPDQVRFLNDAAAYLLGEVRAGAAREIDRAVVITLGTGIGSGFAVHGEVVRGGVGVPPGGEIWNLPYAGGIIEDQVSTRALQKSYRQRTGKDAEVSAIAASAASNPVAAAVFSEFGSHLGQALRFVLAKFAPQVVVLGGGISRSAQLFVPAAQQELEGLGIELRIAQLMDHAPLTGAGAAWFAANKVTLTNSLLPSNP